MENVFAFPDLIRMCDELLRKGDSRRAWGILKEIPVNKVPRKHAWAVANLCRRVNQYSKALKVLSPLIHGEAAKAPDERELAEYAVNLQKVGSVEEAIRILRGIDPEKEPSALLNLAFCHFNIWRYEPAIPMLRHFLQLTDPESYPYFIGLVNLAAAQVECRRDDEARKTLDELLMQAQARGYAKLAGNAHELLAQIDIKLGRYGEAETRLELSRRLLAHDNTTDFLFVRKWKAVVRAFKDGDARLLDAFKAEAAKAFHWETVRECDFYLCQVDRDEDRIGRLYYGTPFAGYRKKIRDSFADWAPKREYTFGKKNKPLLDLHRGTFRGEVIVNLGKKVHELLYLLASDLYRPMRLGDIYSRLFPGENFNIDSSPNRVHQLVMRAKTLLEEHRVPISIDLENHQYRLGGLENVRILYRAAQEFGEKSDFLADSLRSCYADTPFRAKDARERFGIPLTSMNRLIAKELAAGRLVKMGSGPRTRYRFVSAEELPKAG